MALIAISKKNLPKAKPVMPTDLPAVAADSFAVTQAAANYIKSLASTKDGNILRIGILGGGCSGFSYNYKMAQKADEQDFVLNMHEVTVCINQKSLRLLAGSVLDWQEQNKKSGFRIINPQAKTNCSCGQSFSI